VVIAAVVAAVVVTVVVMVAMRPSSPSTAPRHEVSTAASTGDSSVLRDAVRSVGSLENCLAGVRDDLPDVLSSRLAGSRDLHVLVDAGGARLSACQNEGVGRLAQVVGALRPVEPWAIVHATSLAQADVQQAALALAQLMGVLRLVSDHEAGSLPAGSLHRWTTFDRSFHGWLARIGRRHRELGRALLATGS
jgi:hypothetical protein